MRCEDAAELIGAHLDGELSQGQARQIGEHLDACAECRAQVEDVRRISRLVKAAGREPLPEGLESRVRAAVAAEAPAPALPATIAVAAQPAAVQVADAAKSSRSRRASVARWAAAIAAACVLSVLATWALVGRVNHAAEVAHDVLSAHVRSLLQDNTVQVASNDTHNVKPWFAGRIEYSPEVRDLTGEGFALVGGRVDFVDGRRVGAVVYRRRQHVINVFSWPEPGAFDEGPTASILNGYNLVYWKKAGVTHWAISDLNAAELVQLQALL